METKIEKIDKNKINEEIIEEAGMILKNGGLVAFPTETVSVSYTHLDVYKRQDLRWRLIWETDIQQCTDS